MKFFVIFLLFGNSYLFAQYDSLTIKLYDFLKSKKEMSENVKVGQTILIINELVSYQEFKNQEYGIFRFGTLSSHTYIHILLVDKEKYLIVDMYQPLDIILEPILNYLKTNTKITKKNSIQYLEAVLKLYKLNTEEISW
ncbi:MAG: hypothetical protein LBQ60_01070 [Bacteroidales bacterium]|jgi:hypothetical protein|nr:hypothetical protein [Bacteroidales bacterium]